MTELILRDVLLLDIFSLINVHLRNFPIENQSSSNFYFENVLLFVGACTQHHHLQKWWPIVPTEEFWVQFQLWLVYYKPSKPLKFCPTLGRFWAVSFCSSTQSIRVSGRFGCEIGPTMPPSKSWSITNRCQTFIVRGVVVVLLVELSLSKCIEKTKSGKEAGNSQLKTLNTFLPVVTRD